MKQLYEYLAAVAVSSISLYPSAACAAGRHGANHTVSAAMYQLFKRTPFSECQSYCQLSVPSWDLHLDRADLFRTGHLRDGNNLHVVTLENIRV